MAERQKPFIAVYLLLEKDNRILMLRRFNTGYEDGKYSLVAGHVEEGESVYHAIIREAKEETGIILNQKDLQTVHVMHRKSNDERVDFFIKAEKWTGAPTNLEPGKCDDMQWFDLDNLPKNMIPCVRFALEKIMASNFYSEYGW